MQKKSTGLYVMECMCWSMIRQYFNLLYLTLFYSNTLSVILSHSAVWDQWSPCLIVDLYVLILDLRNCTLSLSNGHLYNCVYCKSFPYSQNQMQVWDHVLLHSANGSNPRLTLHLASLLWSEIEGKAYSGIIVHRK